MVLAILILTITVCASLFVLDRMYPPNLKGKTWSTLVTARDGTPLRAFADKNGVWRYPVSLDEVSPLYLKALLTYEDRWFYSHSGVNPFSLIRALFQSIRAGRVVSGGSTLTMQVARIIHPHNRTIVGKCSQILRALQLETRLTKDEILKLYLNLAPFGSNIEGVQTASFVWLGKPALELSHAEAALLAVLPQAPSFYRPDRHPKRAQKARDKVLSRLEKFSVWTKKTVAEAKREPVIALRFIPPVTAPLAARRLYFTHGKQPKIISTLDYDFQIHVQNMIRDYASSLGEKQSVAALVVNHKTLETKAYAGSADFTNPARKGHVDMVKATRSPGSALKPFLYGLALDEGLIHSHSLLQDTPRFQQEYNPGNFSKGFFGPVSVTKALRMSLNVPAVQVLEAYGPQRFHDRLVNAGARLKLLGKPNLSMVLGGVGTNLESLVTLYTALARNGIAGRPKLIKGEPLKERYLMSPGASWIISNILSQPMPGFEGINQLAGHIPMAWKTGTSYGFRDAWALGIMGDYVAGVWVGRPDGSPSPGQYGALTAIPLLRSIFESLPLSDFRKRPPQSVQKQWICWPLGMAKERTSGECFTRHEAWILDNKIPLTLTGKLTSDNSLLQTIWIDQVGNRARPSCGGIKKITLGLWPVSVTPWLPTLWRNDKIIPPPSKECPDIARYLGGSIHITSVTNDSILTRTPGQTDTPSIALATLGSQGKSVWFLNGKQVAVVPQGDSGLMDMPLPGSYQLAVADEHGNTDMVDFKVISAVSGQEHPSEK
ncbi:MAG: penicillin-binding protein 1C [Desulfobacteraceae bacterium]|nr:penicillin-binding protein 1C [Desulfobacteraceae bacterium]